MSTKQEFNKLNTRDKVTDNTDDVTLSIEFTIVEAYSIRGALHTAISHARTLGLEVPVLKDAYAKLTGKINELIRDSQEKGSESAGLPYTRDNTQSSI